MILYGEGGTVDYLDRILKSEEELLYGKYQDLMSQMVNFDNLGKLIPYPNSLERPKEEFIQKERFFKAILIFNLKIRKSSLKAIQKLKENVEKEIERLEK